MDGRKLAETTAPLIFDASHYLYGTTEQGGGNSDGAILFFNGRSPVGWLLTAAGALFILTGIIANMHIYFQPTSLFNTVLMLILLVGGLGLIAKAVRPHHPRETA